MQNMVTMDCFGSGGGQEQGLADRLHSKVSDELWQSIEGTVKSSNSEYGDERAMALAFLVPFESLVDEGVKESILKRLDLNSCGVFADVRGLLKNDEEFFPLWDQWGSELKKVLLNRGLNCVQIAVKEHGLAWEQWSSLPDWFCNSCLGLDWDTLVSVLAGLRDGCLANYSWLLDCQSPMPANGGEKKYLLHVLLNKLSGLIGGSTERLKQLYLLYDELNWSSVVWLQLAVNGECQKVPLYDFLKDGFEWKWGGKRLFPLQVFGCGGSITICLAEYGEESKWLGRFNCSLALDVTSSDPVEKAIAERGEEYWDWRIPFILSDKDKGFNWDGGGKQPLAMLAYRGEESLLTATRRLLRGMGSVFPEGEYSEIIFSNGDRVSILEVNQGVREFLSKLKEKGFPHGCKFV